MHLIDQRQIFLKIFALHTWCVAAVVVRCKVIRAAKGTAQKAAPNWAVRSMGLRLTTNVFLASWQCLNGNLEGQTYPD